MDLLGELCKDDLVIGLSKIKFSKDKVYGPYQMGKQTKSSFTLKNTISTSRPLELSHLDLFGPSRNASLGGMFYAFVIVDDYSRFTWVCFLAHKDDAFKAFKNLAKRVQNEKGFCITTIRSDHGRKFENDSFKVFLQ